MKFGPLIFLVLFGAAVVSAWAWFNAAPPPDTRLIWLEARTNLAGHTFTPEPLSKTALEILGTPECINGSFTPVDPAPTGTKPGQVIRVFSANWSAASGQGMTVVQHTPDICWVGAGWQPVDIGQPKQVEIEIPLANPENSTAAAAGTIKLPFECRVFRSPDGQSRELVLWCTLVSGRVLPEQSRFAPGQTADQEQASNTARQSTAARRLTAGYFAEALKQRLPTRGTKQFVRLSVPVDGLWQNGLSGLKTFAPGWMEGLGKAGALSLPDAKL